MSDKNDQYGLNATRARLEDNKIKVNIASTIYFMALVNNRNTIKILTV